MPGQAPPGVVGPSAPNFASPPPIHALRDSTATWRQPPDTAPQALPWRSDVVTLPLCLLEPEVERIRGRQLNT
jgi:hypothetical protein